MEDWCSWDPPATLDIDLVDMLPSVGSVTFQMGTPSPEAASAIWELVVELRTGIPEIRSAQGVGDFVNAVHGLDRLSRKATKAATWLRESIPDLKGRIDTAVNTLKSAPEEPSAWHTLIEIADRLEEMIGTAPIWLIEPDRPG